MNVSITDTGQEAELRYLRASIRHLRRTLERSIQQSVSVDDHLLQSEERESSEAAQAMSVPPALDRLCRAFELSSFERDVLLMAAGIEIDPSFGQLCAGAHRDPTKTYPTFGLALALSTESSWKAITPEAPLRRWRMIELASGPSITNSALRISEQILHFLTGVSCCDELLRPLLELVPVAEYSSQSERILAEQLARSIACTPDRQKPPLLQLTGADNSGKSGIAALACSSLGLQLWRLNPQFIPSVPAELETVVRLCEREAILGSSAFLIELENTDRSAHVTKALEHLDAPIFTTIGDRQWELRRTTLNYAMPHLNKSEQLTIWRHTLGSQADGLNGQVDKLLAQFSLDATGIRSVSGEALQRQTEQPSRDLGQHLWDVCRVHSRPKLDGLAQRIESKAGWDDLVLPPPQRTQLDELAGQLRQRSKVYEAWGFAEKCSRGLGLSALFAGPSGAGKTLAAEVLANELGLELYRIDLSQVVSKYIGETEKNLRCVFDAADQGSAILLFDEADALFGKRSEVKDSHDRYANIEISYLLQRMEAYRGLAILTTNLKNVLDTAFLRRLRFVVNFPFPDANQRELIWERVFPASTPRLGLAYEKLAKLNVTGGNIRNIALNAAFLAADAGEPVQMSHVARAAASEYAKLEKHLTDVELGGWA